jgi:hypothetical protein
VLTPCMPRSCRKGRSTDRVPISLSQIGRVVRPMHYHPSPCSVCFHFPSC